MQKYKQAAMSIAFLTLLLTAGAFAGVVNSQQLGQDNPAQARQEAILNSFEDNDYDAWREQVGKKSDIGAIVSQSDFRAFVEARRAARSGDYDKAIAISTKLESELKDKISTLYLS
jgi:hypothetical protein